MKWILAAIASLAVLFGGAGGATWLLERRLAALAPGGFDVQALHYNPFTGRLHLQGITARDRLGREVFHADSVEASAPAAEVLGGTVTLTRARVQAPRMVVPAGPLLALAGRPTELPLAVRGLVATVGSLRVESAGFAPLHLSDVSVRADAIAEAAHHGAFAMTTTAYGTVIRLTGQPGVGGYAVRIRAAGLDAAAVLRDFPVLASTGLRLTRARGDVDAELLFARSSRLLVSGALHLNDVVARVPDAGVSPLSAAAVIVAVDRWDVEAGAGRIARLEVRRPKGTVDVARSAPVLARLVDRLGDAGIILRRVRLVDGTLTLVDPEQGRLTLRGLALALQARERRAEAGFVVTGRSGLGPAGRLTFEGALSRDLHRIDGVIRAIDVRLPSCTVGDTTVAIPAPPSVPAVAAALMAGGCAARM